VLTIVWGVGGVVALLLQALVRLGPIAAEALGARLTLLQVAFAVVWVAFMAHAEGYRGFHLRFSPRVVARAHHLARHPRPLWVVFAPLFCMSLFGASRRGVWVARCVLAGVFALVLVVRALPQPWRGLVDAGVVVGLGIGLASLLYYTAMAWRGRPSPVDPDLS